MNQDVPFASSSGDDATINNIPRPIQRGRSAHHYSEHITCASSDFNTTTLSMARAEVAGYRLSRLAMNSHNDCHLSTTISEDDNKSAKASNGNNNYMTEQRRIFMPEILYFSHDDDCNIPTYPIINLSIQNNNEERNDGESNCENNKYKCNNTPWALMSYFENGANHSESQTIGNSLDVEVDSAYLGIDFNMTKIEKRKPHDISSNDPMYPASTIKSRTLIPCHHFPTTMVKVRHEFGFNEPHPRHGRVPTDECLDYAMMVLHNVVIQIQTYFFMLGSDLSVNDDDDTSILKCSRYDNTISTNLTSLGWSNPNQAAW